MDYYSYSLDDISQEDLIKLIGKNDENLLKLEELYKTDIVIRENELRFLSTDMKKFLEFSKHVDYLLKLSEIDENMVNQTYNSDDTLWNNTIIGYNASSKPIKCKTKNQYKLIKAIERNDLTFAIGPAGTGKTYLAVLMAVKAYKEGLIKRIILTRPAVEAGESLGFLPGDLKEKIQPYLMPLYDSLFDIMGQETVEKLVEKGTIEILPLAYMRGRTLNESFIILDEAQNTTNGQMLMFLTRLGKDSKMIVNGDITQIDLNISRNKSGLVIALDKLKDIKKISFVEFENKDIIRNPLVQEIIEKY